MKRRDGLVAAGLFGIASLCYAVGGSAVSAILLVAAVAFLIVAWRF